MNQLSQKIKSWGLELGFQQVLISKTDLSNFYQRFIMLINKQYHADMDYLFKNIELRFNPELLVEDARSIIITRMDYLPPHPDITKTLRQKDKAYIARYALGRDYHRLIRQRLKQLAKKIEAEVGVFNWRPFADSAPVLDKPLAVKAGLGWQGKNTLILNRQAGSYFFIGALYTSLELEFDSPITNHCGSCTACLDICPTDAFPAPYQLDSRRCISYWTIENKGSIPTDIRHKMGNRVFGCDDCQLICPWNKFAKTATETAFLPRHRLNDITLLELFSWNKDTYLKNTEGSAIRRTGYDAWVRNIAIGLGNAPKNDNKRQALLKKLSDVNDTAKEHILWALDQENIK